MAVRPGPFVNAAEPAPGRVADTHRFYALLSRISERTGGYRHLATCDGRMEWPRRGVYFFFEAGEPRSDPDAGLRVTRIGTHALKTAAGTSLWNRLATHRGSSRSGAGHHRGSIFRKLVGSALAHRGDAPLPPSWGDESDPAAARKLGWDRARVQRAEIDLERRVSEYIGRMPFLWLGIDDPPGPASKRGWVEQNAIALLSHARTPAVDAPSDRWLGAFSDREGVRASGLWNQRHVAEPHDPSFLDEMDELVTRWSE